ncbi:hypothetical protein L0F63_006614, partial [Massospora cicadina]
HPESSGGASAALVEASKKFHALLSGQYKVDMESLGYELDKKSPGWRGTGRLRAFTGPNQPSDFATGSVKGVDSSLPSSPCLEEPKPETEKRPNGSAGTVYNTGSPLEAHSLSKIPPDPNFLGSRISPSGAAPKLTISEAPLDETKVQINNGKVVPASVAEDEPVSGEMQGCGLPRPPAMQRQHAVEKGKSKNRRSSGRDPEAARMIQARALAELLAESGFGAQRYSANLTAKHESEKEQQTDFLALTLKEGPNGSAGTVFNTSSSLEAHYLSKIHPDPSFWRSLISPSETAPKLTTPEAPLDEPKVQINNGMVEPASVAEDEPVSGEMQGCGLPSSPAMQRQHAVEKEKPKNRRSSGRDPETALMNQARALAEMVRAERGDVNDSMYTIRSQRPSVDSLQSENFSLKLKVFYLEEKLIKTEPGYLDSVHKENMQYRVQAQEALRECKRYREMLQESNGCITKLSHDLKALKACNDSPKKKLGVEVEADRHLQEFKKYRKQFKSLKDTIACQDRDIKMLESALNRYRATVPDTEPAVPAVGILPAQLLELEDLKRANQRLHQENEKLAAETVRMQSLLKDKLTCSSCPKVNPKDEMDEKVELRQMVAQLQDENRHLAGSQQRLHSDLEMYEREVCSLKSQLADLMDSPPSASSSQQQALLIENLRNQLEAAKDRLAHPEPCAACAARSNENSADKMEERPIQSAEALKGPPRSKIRQPEEVRRTVGACKGGADDTNAVSTAFETNGELPHPHNELIKQSQAVKSCADHPKIGPSEPLIQRDDLLRSVLEGLAKFVPVSLECDPLDDFEGFKITVLGAVASAAHLFGDQVKHNVHRAEVELKAKVNDLKAQLGEKSNRLEIAFNRAAHFSTRYSELKEKAIILKSRLIKAKTYNDALKLKVRQLEATSQNSESLLDAVSVDE